jgi:hypothetical protein
LRVWRRTAGKKLDLITPHDGNGVVALLAIRHCCKIAHLMRALFDEIPCI